MIYARRLGDDEESQHYCRCEDGRRMLIVPGTMPLIAECVDCGRRRYEHDRSGLAVPLDDTTPSRPALDTPWTSGDYLPHRTHRGEKQ